MILFHLWHTSANKTTLRSLDPRARCRRRRGRNSRTELLYQPRTRERDVAGTPYTHTHPSLLLLLVLTEITTSPTTSSTTSSAASHGYSTRPPHAPSTPAGWSAPCTSNPPRTATVRRRLVRRAKGWARRSRRRMVQRGTFSSSKRREIY